nr:hypothetical protein [uncultured Draconibacterium sp.]
MRTILIILIGLISVTGFSQTDYDLQTTYLLTINEATSLNSIFSKESDNFDFKGKSIAFAVGTTGTQIVNKNGFFEKYINPVIEGKNKNVCLLIVLTKEEKLKSGGFDAVVMSPAKIFTKEHREKLIIELNEISKSLHDREKYELIEKVDLKHDFLINSVSTFKSYCYVGSDDTFHYFTAKWDLKKDKFFKFTKSDLIVNEPSRFGQIETNVSLIQSDKEFGHDDKDNLYKVK